MCSVLCKLLTSGGEIAKQICVRRVDPFGKDKSVNISDVDSLGKAKAIHVRNVGSFGREESTHVRSMSIAVKEGLLSLQREPCGHTSTLTSMSHFWKPLMVARNIYSLINQLINPTLRIFSLTTFQQQSAPFCSSTTEIFPSSLPSHLFGALALNLRMGALFHHGLLHCH